ncbi:MAG: ABC transporter substrate-binding protein [Deltaproteobacteria bacterium]|jgi:ABC-type uncharacterized transport system substrate-binding protein|nr:ABC transporter substrate-binding protein [Deltaproteobacteria bacterium]
MTSARQTIYSLSGSLTILLALPVIAAIVFCLAIIAPSLSTSSWANELNQESKLWRVIYVEAGSYRDYSLNLVGLAKGLKELNLIERAKPLSDESASVWRYLSEQAGGTRLKFLEDGFYSANWDKNQLIAIKNKILSRIKAGEVDLILTFGTQAGQSLATEEHNTPVLSITATDPVAAGIVKQSRLSGLEHVHAQVESGNLWRQLSLFHNVFHFKTLGVPLDSTAEGQATMGLKSIEAVAKEKGFEIISCVSDLESPDFDKNFQNLLKCLNRLTVESEAIYLTVNNGMREDRFGQILAPIVAAKKPSFSQKGPDETRQGVLLSLAEDDFIGSGRFEANVIQKILNGQSPGSIDQIYVAPLTMALNFQMAKNIGWNPPFEFLASVDALYPTMVELP